MTSEVEICKRALAYIRARSINSLDDQTVEGTQCKLMYPFARDQLLSLGWSFAESQKKLALRTDTVEGWEYVYDYPNDCMIINKLFTQDLQSDRQLDVMIQYKSMNIDGNRVIVCNYENAVINYTMKVTDVSLFPVLFQSALSHLIAAEIAIPIIGVEKGAALRNVELQLYNQITNSALAQDGNQSVAIVPQSDFIRVRDNGANNTTKFYGR